MTAAPGLTSCFVSLAALLALANPAADTRLRSGEASTPYDRTVWVLLPAVALFLLLVVLAFTMMPMQARA